VFSAIVSTLYYTLLVYINMKYTRNKTVLAWWMFASWITIVQHMSYPGGSLQRHELNSKMQLSVVVHVHIIL